MQLYRYVMFVILWSPKESLASTHQVKTALSSTQRTLRTLQLKQYTDWLSVGVIQSRVRLQLQRKERRHWGDRAYNTWVHPCMEVRLRSLLRNYHNLSCPFCLRPLSCPSHHCCHGDACGCCGRWSEGSSAAEGPYPKPYGSDGRPEALEQTVRRDRKDISKQAIRNLWLYLWHD